jgi:hypothetical protein
MPSCREICTETFPIRGQLKDIKVPEECPPEVRALVLECLETRPSLRPSAQQLVARLQTASDEGMGRRAVSASPVISAEPLAPLGCQTSDPSTFVGLELADRQQATPGEATARWVAMAGQRPTGRPPMSPGRGSSIAGGQPTGESSTEGLGTLAAAEQRCGIKKTTMPPASPRVLEEEVVEGAL